MRSYPTSLHSGSSGPRGAVPESPQRVPTRPPPGVSPPSPRPAPPPPAAPHRRPRRTAGRAAPPAAPHRRPRRTAGRAAGRTADRAAQVPSSRRVRGRMGRRNHPSRRTTLHRPARYCPGGRPNSPVSRHRRIVALETAVVAGRVSAATSVSTRPRRPCRPASSAVSAWSRQPWRPASSAVSTRSRQPWWLAEWSRPASSAVSVRVETAVGPGWGFAAGGRRCIDEPVTAPGAGRVRGASA
ncbi:hypothetical protein SAMN05421541_103440 [Actinoplanes philippinensis]|uniref:Uncharacterized protein n=1 Tax=Actinoplanes philippinensis TaxID=35752 RepID=A0A1I2D6C3_9ACTN|nr:hypothetical protein SAMN05421541_103440 [Actinoplanes philippinensis]